MDRALEETDPYSIDGLQTPSYFTLQPIQPLESLSWDEDLPGKLHFPPRVLDQANGMLLLICLTLDLTRGVYSLPTDLFSKNDSTLYQLDVFGLHPIESNEPSEPSISSPSNKIHTENNDSHEEADHLDDIWKLNTSPEYTSRPSILKSWDNFPEHLPRAAAPAYLSEAGRRGFDAALAHSASKTGLEDSGRVAHTNIFISSLFRLGLGWNSIFFRYNEQTRKFEKDIKDARISGISLGAIDGLIEEILSCGTKVRMIRRFIQFIPTQIDSPPPLSSLARAAFILLHGYEEQVLERSMRDPSLLQTQMLFRKAGCLLTAIVGIIHSVEHTKSDGEVISSVFARCDYYSDQFFWLNDVLREIMTLVAEPWLSSVESWIGLRPEPATLLEFDRNGKGFINFGVGGNSSREAMSAHSTNITLRLNAMPSFVPPDHAITIFESGKSLRLLKSFRAHHPLSRNISRKSSSSLSLEGGVTWDGINRIQRKANEYEAKLRAEILRYHENQETYSYTTDDEENIPARVDDHPGLVDDVFALFDIDDNRSTELAASAQSHELGELLVKSQCFDAKQRPGDDLPFGPPLASSVYLSLAPVIASQTRLINFSCLHLLFRGHNVREHLHLQWRFQLLGDGIFSSRLSHVLFDPDMQSGERKRGVVRGGSSTGLRLGSRDTWPPASSELRLVLTGLLSDCYTREGSTKRSGMKDHDLPGALSFAIRDLAGEELLKCKDPNSIQALDFLRLQYSPPSVLDAIITQRSLRKYDRLFKHLLRLLRMLSVTQGLVRDSTDRNINTEKRTIVHKFRFEASRFIEAISDYCFHIAVGRTWDNFEKTLMKTERCVERGDFDGAMENAKGLHHLRDYHEDVLDQISFACLLNKRHAQASKLLEDIFGVILSFASMSKPMTNTTDESGRESRNLYDQSAQRLHTVFRRKVGNFIQFLKALEGVKAMRSRGKHINKMKGIDRSESIDTSSVFGHLLLRLDLTDYYRI